MLALFGKEDAFHARWVLGCTPSISLDSKLGFLLFQPQDFFCSNSIFVPVPFLEFLWFQPQDLFSFNPRICLIVFPWLLLGFLCVKEPISSSFICDAFHTKWVLVWIYFQLRFSSCNFALFFWGDRFFSESILFWVKSYQVVFQHKCFYCLSSHSAHRESNDILRARCSRHLESNVKEITHSESSKTTFPLLLLY